MPPRLLSILGAIKAAACASVLLTSATAISADETKGTVVEGLQLSVAVLPHKDAANPQFRVTFSNVGESDFVLNLGSMLGNGQTLTPDQIQLQIVTPDGTLRDLKFAAARAAGRMDDYLVPLRAGSEYSVRLGLSDFWSPATKEFKIEPAPGDWKVVASFEGTGARHVNVDMPAVKLLSFWTGKVESNTEQWKR